jgi:hypothetical protein
MSEISYIRRAEAGKYLRQKWGFGSHSTLAKLAMNGDGPPMRRVGEKIVLYSMPELDAWAKSLIGERRMSTSE